MQLFAFNYFYFYSLSEMEWFLKQKTQKLTKTNQSVHELKIN